MLQGKTFEATAREVGCCSETLRRWRRDNASFAAKIEEGLASLEQQAEDLLRGGLPASMQRVHELVDSTNESVALGAARTSLEGWDRLLRARQVDQRIAELEARLEAAVLEVERRAGIAPPEPEQSRNDPDQELS